MVTSETHPGNINPVTLIFSGDPPNGMLFRFVNLVMSSIYFKLLVDHNEAVGKRECFPIISGGPRLRKHHLSCVRILWS